MDEVHSAVPGLCVSLGLIVSSLLFCWLGLHNKRNSVRAALVGLSCLCWSGGLMVLWSLLL
jgi:hypothetical protein